MTQEIDKIIATIEVYERLRGIDTSNFNSSSEVEAYRDGYIDCSKWAVSTLIEKACEWLKEEYPKAAAYYEHPDSFIDRFKQAMKGD